MYQIITTPEFDEDLASLSRAVTERIIKKVEWLSNHPELLKNPLKNMPDSLKGLQKYRVGSYRILFWAEHRTKTIVLYGVEHRRSVYKKI